MLKPRFVLLILLLILLIMVHTIITRAETSPQKTLVVNLADADLTYVGEDVGDWASYFLSPAGDVNGDGLGDVLVGAPMAGDKSNPNFVHGEGKAYLILGKPESQWPETPASLAEAEASFLGCKLPSMTARQLYTAGDVNGDGYDDFLISGWKCGNYYQGKAYLFLGRPNIDWGIDYPVEQADASFLGEYELDFASYYVSTVGDVNGDGFDDFLVTSPQSYDAGEDRGKIYLFLGRAQADWGTDFPLSQADASFIGEYPGDRAGRSATGVGDVNGDGYDDFIIGAMSSNDIAGAVYLILGRAQADWGQRFSLANADASFIGETTGDEVGRRASWAGDVNGDGYDDILIGAPKNDQVNLDAGKAYIILGRPEADWGLNYSLALADAIFLGEARSDLAGRRLNTVGDVNQDGYADFVIGAPHSKRGGPRSGTAYLIFGKPEADWGRAYPLSLADAIYIGKEDVGSAGYDMGPIGDFNGDGIDDFLIGAFGGRADIAPGDSYIMLGRVAPLPAGFISDRTEGNTRSWYRFSGEYWEPNGWMDIKRVRLMMGLTLNDPKMLDVVFDPGENAFFLLDNLTNQWVGPCTPGQDKILETNFYHLDCRASTVTYLTDHYFRVTWRIRWVQLSMVDRQLKAYLQGSDLSGNGSGPIELGSWMLKADEPLVPAFLPVIGG
ncbi:MAG: FG-GAP repeat protein [Anaerolineales bacterium]|nr:FG-GAP repeat protein [Anaerolineales bacterium]